MSYLDIEEMKTHLHKGQVDVISFGDDTLLQASIDAALAETKGYLRAYDINKEFDKVGDNRNALLLIFIKDIAVWHFVNICNAGTDLQLRADRYNRAIDYLKSVQRGDVVPDLEALPDEKKAGIILHSSNNKRDNHY